MQRGRWYNHAHLTSERAEVQIRKGIQKTQSRHLGSRIKALTLILLQQSTVQNLQLFKLGDFHHSRKILQ